MGLFGFKSKKEVEEEKRKAAAEAARRVEENNLTNLTNLSTGSQVNIAIPYFDVFDPRLTDTGVPVAVHGSIVYAIEDLDMFHSINKREAYSDETFQNKLRGTVTKFVKSVVSNAPSDANIPVVQLERKVLEISNLVESYIVPKVEALFGIKVRSFDITAINVDKDSRGYRELKAVTADIEQSNILSQKSLNDDINRMNLEHQRETMRIQREEMQRASRLQTEQTFLGAHQANLNAKVVNNASDNGLNAFRATSTMGMPQMPGTGMGMPSMGAPSMQSEPIVQYMVGVNGQQAGPFNWQQMKQLVQQGQLTVQSYVWKQGMPQWALAGQVMELQPLFASAMPPMPGMPPQMPGF
ncbi:MAG: GYF domain-containing protein [Muribaculaceae bacterium]|nr:GYF domain-containing protein [Muribaculaceae bacterium]